jgi:hypothetical protein
MYDLSQTVSPLPVILRSEGKGVKIIEIFALGTEFIGSVFAYLAEVALLAFVVSVVLFGYMSEEESRGNRLFWAEWPIPESGEPEAEEEVRLAA